jgi:hypothetical protein
MASGAGINRQGTQGGVILLDNITTTVTAVTTPLTGYGTMLSNDSGGQMLEAIGFSKWMFHLVALTSTALTGIGVTLYGTISPNAYNTFTNVNLYGQTPTPNSPFIGAGTGPVAVSGINNNAAFSPGVQPWEWFAIPGPSEQAGTGTIANPLTSTQPLLFSTIPLVAVRAVVTSAATAGVGRVLAFAIP